MSERQQQQKCVLPLKKCETYRNEERRQDRDHVEMKTFKSNDGGNSPQGRQRVWSSLRGNFGKSNPQYEHGGYEPQLSHHQEDDGNVMMRNVQEYPQVRQDGQTLPPAIIDTDAPYLIKSRKESSRGSEKLKSLILQFLQQYYLIYDSEDRQGLLCAYHYKACFSLTIPFNPKDPAPSSLCMYFKESRNMKKIKDPYLRVQLLKHTKHDIVCSLSTLPKTQHDISSFVVDMWFHTEMMLCFSVNGVFKEVEGRSQGSVRAFTRTFIATPTNNSSLCIVNDELFVRDASPNETQSMSSIPVSSSTSSSVFILSKEQQEMVQAFSTQSWDETRVVSEWCLQDNEWNYTRAGQVFTMLKNEGKIPEDAFKQIA
ncbi:nuclear RNA export factor 2-like [Prionailurus iriomotensis]